MKHQMITIGREYGSGGHKIGQMVADRLHLSFYDNELVTLAAERGDLGVQKLQKHDEKKPNPMMYEVNYEGNEYVTKGEPVSETLFELQRDVILGIADREDAVIVGRCADDVLKRAGIQTLSIFIAAPFEERIKRTMDKEGLTEKTVCSLTKKKDKTRKSYYESHTRRSWGNPNNYDLYFDTSEYSSFNEIADLIVEEYLKRT